MDFTELIQELKRTPIPSGVVYEPAVKELEALPIRLDISSVFVLQNISGRQLECVE